MKKINKPSNPLKVFNDNRAMAYKKAGGAMKDFKKSLPKAQYGAIQGPLNEKDQKNAEGFINRIMDTGSSSTLKHYTPSPNSPDQTSKRLNSIYQMVRDESDFNTNPEASKFPYGKTDSWKGIPYAKPGMKKGGPVKEKGGLVKSRKKSLLKAQSGYSVRRSNIANNG